MLSRPKNPQIAALLAFLGVIIPISGLHKFYLGQPLWGLCYIVLSLGTPIPKIASAIEGVWYLAQSSDEFDQNFNPMLGRSTASQPPASYPTQTAQAAQAAQQVVAVADALRQLEQLRQEGLISEYEFEQKRRQFLDRV